MLCFPSQAVKLTSTKTQLPYEYYFLPFCVPKEGIIYKTENLGESCVIFAISDLSSGYICCIKKKKALS